MEKTLGNPNRSLVSKEEYKRIYRCWYDMLLRCYNKDRKDYKTYGGKGITVCDEWFCFETFYNDYLNLEGYEKDIKKCLDKDMKNLNNKIYSKENCKLVTRKENNSEMNLRLNQYEFKAISPDGKTYYSDNINKFAKEHGFNISGVWKSLNKLDEQYKSWKFEKI